MLGQPDFVTAFESPYAPQSADRFRFPDAACLEEGRLAVADTANNRVLLFDEVPSASAAAADAVLGQHGSHKGGEDRWSGVERDTLCWPYGLHLRGDLLAVADSGKNRVMLWRQG